MKVFVVLLDGTPHVFSNRGQLMKEVEQMKLPFTPTIHECEVQKRGYSRKEGASPTVSTTTH